MKTFILFLLSITPAVFAYRFLKNKQNAIRQFYQLSQLFDQIDRINSVQPLELIPLFTILSDCDIYNSFCSHILQYLNKDQSFELAWCDGIELFFCSITEKHTITELKNFSKLFPVGNIRDQSVLCDRMQLLCNEEIKFNKEFLKNNNKLMFTGSILIGFLVFILFC